MDVRSLVAAWPQAPLHQQMAWAQQVRFDVTLGPEDVPALVDLYRVVLASHTEAQRVMEEALLTALTRIANPQALSLLAELLDPLRPYRGQTPLAEIVEAVVQITGRSAAEEGVRLLERCLQHPDVDVRDMATTGIVRACLAAGIPVPEEVCAQLFAMLQNDPVRRVRFSAGLALHEAGKMDLVDVIFWAEDMAGWEEDPTWAISDEEPQPVWRPRSDSSSDTAGSA